MTFTLPTLGKGRVATTLMLSAAILGAGLAPVSAEWLNKRKRPPLYAGVFHSTSKPYLVVL